MEQPLIDETLIIDNLPCLHNDTRWDSTSFQTEMGNISQLAMQHNQERAQFPLIIYNGKILRINTDGKIPEDNPYKWYATRVMWLRK